MLSRTLAGRLIGVVSAATTLLLCALALLGIGMDAPLHGPSRYVFGSLAALALLAAAAAWLERAAALILIAVLSLIPVGLYLLGVPHWLKWVGAANLGYLAAAALLWSRGRSRGGSES